MCRFKSLITAIVLLPFLTIAQSKTSIEQYHVAGNNRSYMPMSIAHLQSEKNWYAEGRYNYEDAETFSLYLGKTFARNKALSYSLTPILGGVIGNFNGVSAGINMDLDYSRFSFSGQSQYSFSIDQRTDNFFYNWSELVYQPLAWLYSGVSVQNTRLYKTETVLEPGVLVGFTFRNVTIPFYTFAPFKKSRYFILGLTIEWEKSRQKRPGKHTVEGLVAE